MGNVAGTTWRAWEHTHHILLISIEYDRSRIEGPPFSVPESEVRSLFAADAVDKLHEYDCLEDEPRFRERGLTWMKEALYHVRPAPNCRMLMPELGH